MSLLLLAPSEEERRSRRGGGARIHKNQVFNNVTLVSTLKYLKL